MREIMTKIVHFPKIKKKKHVAPNNLRLTLTFYIMAGEAISWSFIYHTKITLQFYNVVIAVIEISLFLTLMALDVPVQNKKLSGTPG